ncbi:MAG TPA: exodeoxyribonuclease VII large subunit [Candidatus Limnocylindria bacterium]|nr:exodeoxyribonuclease VII large subunit [Candidatus Limnocylindria bacterium]
MSISSAPPKDTLRVGQLVIRLAERIQSGDEFKDLWVEGEVVDATVSAAGHVYFTLRDQVGQLACVLFATQAARIALTPRDGAKVIAHGYVEYYHKQSRVQLRVDDVRPAGMGDAYLRLEALKKRLTAEGLFALERKRPLPSAPRRVGVITSQVGAVWHDIQTVVARRDPRVELVFAPALVQGPGAVDSLVAALEGMRQLRDVDVVIIARGGGSPEDLIPFNDEALVRAIARRTWPVVSGVGHETDVTLCDLVADVRAPTPSAAAELVVPDARVGQLTADRTMRRLASRVREALEGRRRRLVAAHRLLERRAPPARVGARRQQLDEHRRALDRAIARAVPVRRQRLAHAKQRLDALSPLGVLGRGYAIVEGADGRVRAGVSELRRGDAARIRMRDGRASVTVEGVDPNGRT